MGKRTLGEFYQLSDLDQRDAVALWTEEQGKCPKCGRPREECSDPNRAWHVHRSICFVSRAQQAADAAYAARHESMPWHDGTYGKYGDLSWAKEQNFDTHPYRFDHGVTVWVDEVDHDPDDNFTGARDAQPKVLRAPIESDEEG